MKKNLRGTKCSLLFVILVALLMSLSLAACGKEEAPVESEGESQAGEEAQTEKEGAYTIVYDGDLGEDAVEACEKLSEYLGADYFLTADQPENGAGAAVSEREILLGSTNRPESAALTDGLGKFDYKIEVQGTKLVVAGGSDDALIHAIAHLMRDENFSLDRSISQGYQVSFDGADNRDEYIANPDLFLSNWTLDFEVPEWMHDFEEKMAAFRDADGRVMSSIHRGDSMNYPENSIEGIISAIQMGGDNVEIDVRRTKDNVLVLMHDEKLIRTTDWAEKNGKNGLPTSEYLADWTFEELRQLRLKERNGNLTEYIIPTLQEALQVCCERITIRLDKTECWDWDTEVYPMVQELGAWRTCLVNFEFDLEKQERIVETIKTESGKEPVLFYRVLQDNRETWRERVDMLLEKGYQPMVRWTISLRGMEQYVKIARPSLDEISGDVRIYTEMQMLGGGTESYEDFDFMVENGATCFLVDMGLNIQKYIAENYRPTEY